MSVLTFYTLGRSKATRTGKEAKPKVRSLVGSGYFQSNFDRASCRYRRAHSRVLGRAPLRARDGSRSAQRTASRPWLAAAPYQGLANAPPLCFSGVSGQATRLSRNDAVRIRSARAVVKGIGPGESHLATSKRPDACCRVWAWSNSTALSSAGSLPFSTSVMVGLMLTSGSFPRPSMGRSWASQM